MPIVNDLKFVQAGSSVNGHYVVKDHRVFKKDFGNLCENFITAMPQDIWEQLISSDNNSDLINNFNRVVDELKSEIDHLPNKKLYHDVDSSGQKKLASKELAMESLQFKGTPGYLGHNFFGDNGVYGGNGYPILLAKEDGRDVFIRYPQILAASYEMLKKYLPDNPKKNRQQAAEIILMVLQSEQCAAGNMIVCINEFIKHLLHSGAKAEIKDIVKNILNPTSKSYVPLSPQTALAMFNELKDMSILYNGIIPKPTDDVRNNYNSDPKTFAFYSYTVHTTQGDLIIDYGRLKKSRHKLAKEIRGLEETARASGGEVAVRELLEQQAYIDKQFAYQTINNLLAIPEHSIKHIRSGVGYDTQPKIASPKVFLQICWALLGEAVGLRSLDNLGVGINSATNDAVGKIVVDTLVDAEGKSVLDQNGQEQQITLAQVLHNNGFSNNHFGDMTDQEIKDAFEQLDKFRIWINNGETTFQNLGFGVYPELDPSEIKLLKHWGAAVAAEMVAANVSLPQILPVAATVGKGQMLLNSLKKALPKLSFSSNNQPADPKASDKPLNRVFPKSDKKG